MTNIFRFVLAVFVVIAHLTSGVAFFSHWGVFAVFGFYVISGYLITFILNEGYSFKLAPFALNRFIRLFPIYYIVVLVSIIVFWALPGAGEFHRAWIEKDRLIDYFGNVFIFPFAFYDATYRISPPTWSVAVELINYLILWLFSARSKKTALITLSVSIAYHAVSLNYGAHWHRVYSPFYAAMLPFSLGSCTYFFRKEFEKQTGRYLSHLLIASASLFFLNIVWCGKGMGLYGKNFIWFFYFNLLVLTIFIACITSGKFEKTKKFKIFGDLAYPIFLTHWIVAYVVSETLLGGKKHGGALFASSIVPIILFSWLLVSIANKWFEPLRDSIRKKINSRSAIS